ncbi:MAG: serine/threonine protein kinase, partial [Gemmatimonadetes bacterium]|nr:serine/threonine protein kinase [Gemmatimonadota bacterium]
MSTKGIDEFQGTERFGILRRLGAGGMGIVYEAYDREREELVALKVLRNLAAESVLQFKQEFRSLAQTVHPNLVPLYELISDGNQWFFTMELLKDSVAFVDYVRTEEEGGGARAKPPPGHLHTSSDLTIGSSQESAGEAGDEDDRRAKSSPPSKKVVAPIPDERPPVSGVDFERLRDGLRQLVEGTNWLHDAGIVHRDLKPENVLVRPGGRVTLLDFGLVAPLAGVNPLRGGVSFSGSSPAHGESTERRIVGSIGYMSPEQAADEPLTPATDWYAVGVILYRSLTGRLPFEGRAHEVLEAKQRIDPPAPAALFEGIPADLDALCMRLLDRNAARRPRAIGILAGIGAGSASEETDGAAG